MANSFQVATKSRMKQRRQHRQRDRQEDAAEDGEMRCAVDQRRLAQFLRHIAEEAVQDEHLVGHAEGEVGQDDARIGVDQAEAVHQREERRQHHLERDHRAEQDGDQDAPCFHRMSMRASA